MNARRHCLTVVALLLSAAAARTTGAEKHDETVPARKTVRVAGIVVKWVLADKEANYRRVPGIAAATILGDGRVALILDIDALVAASRTAEAPRLLQAG